jgi:hypothetical protein
MRLKQGVMDANGRSARLSMAAGGVALLLLALLVHSIIAGAPSAVVVRLGKPKVVVTAAAFLGLAGAFLTARRRGAEGALLRKLVLLGFSLAVSLAAGEILVRAYLHEHESEGGFGQLQKMAAGGELHAQSFTPLLAISKLSANKRLLYELRPGLDREFGNRTLHINQHGMRDSLEYDPAGTGAVRIVGIGDSGMFGWGVDQDQDYLSVLESNLNATNGGPRYEVLNLAVPGYNTGQEVEMLRARGLAFKPRIVIVGWCDNDFSAPFLVLKKKDYSSLRKSYLYSLMFYRKELLAAEVCKPDEIDRSMIDPALLEYTDVAGVRKAMLELRDLGRANGFQVLVFGSMRKEAVEICREAGFSYFNIRDRIDNRKYPSNYCISFMHPAPGGHRALASHLQAELKRLGWLD